MKIRYFLIVFCVSMGLMWILIPHGQADRIDLKDKNVREGEIIFRDQRAIYLETSEGIIDIEWSRIEAINDEAVIVEEKKPTAENQVSESQEREPLSLDAGYRRYQLKSGMIEYTVAGGPGTVSHLAVKGRETVYFDEWGLWESRLANVEMELQDGSQADRSLSLSDGNWTYGVDLERKTARKTADVFAERARDYPEEKNLGDYGAFMIKKWGGVKTGTDTILGRTCEVWEIKNQDRKACVWKDIPLRMTEKVIDKEITVTATQIEENIVVSRDKFNIPGWVKIEDAGHET